MVCFHSSRPLCFFQIWSITLSSFKESCNGYLQRSESKSRVMKRLYDS